MSSKIQLQQIEDIGLLVYYDNKDYYQFDLETQRIRRKLICQMTYQTMMILNQRKIQRKRLIDELNLYGFNIDYDVLGLDKLRTLYYGKEMYSKNQNG